MIPSEPRPPLVIYHGNCTDGWTAAWAVHTGLRGECELFAGFYGQAPPDVFDRDVVLVDFSYKRDVIVAMRQRARSLLILDHHKTSAADLAPDGGGFIDIAKWTGALRWQRHLENAVQDAFENALNTVYVLFDQERSGARLAWDFFHGPDRPRPWLVDYVMDRDLWQWRLPLSRFVSAGIEAVPKTLGDWDALVQKSMHDVAAEGMTIERYRDICITAACNLARRATIGGVSVLVANSSEVRFASDTAHRLAERDGEPFAATWWLRHDGKVQFSLRSVDGGTDVSEVARGYGGGGHVHAAGFECSFATLRAILGMPDERAVHA